MAFEVKRIDPLDLQPRKAVGLEIPFSAKEVFSSNYQTKDAIRTNLINFFLTSRGERYLNPLFGTPIREKLFDNITQDKLSEIQAIVEEGLAVYFPRVEALDIQAGANPDNNLVQFYLSYRIVDTNIEDEILINIEQ